MLFTIILLVIFSFILFLILGLSIGIAFLLAWLFPNIPFATAVVIGAISSSFSIYFFVQLVVFVMGRGMYGLDRIYGVEDEGEYSEDLEEDAEYIILPPTAPQSKRKKRQKRKR